MEDIAQQKILRVFKLLRLLGTKPYQTLPQLARALEVDERTVKRYIELLEDLGYLIDQKSGSKVYFLFEGEESPIPDQPTLFDADETTLLRYAIENSELPPDAKKQLAYKMFVNSGLTELPQSLIHHHQAQIAAAVREAAERQCQLRLIAYFSANSNSYSDRLVEPLEMESQYFTAYEPQSGQVKKFKFERVGKAKVLNKKRSYQGEGLQKDLFHMSGTQATPFSLSLHPQAYHLLKEEFPAAQAHCTPQGDRYLFTHHYYDPRGIGRFILGLPGRIQILEPETLRTYVREMAGVMLGENGGKAQE